MRRSRTSGSRWRRARSPRGEVQIRPRRRFSGSCFPIAWPRSRWSRGARPCTTCSGPGCAISRCARRSSRRTASAASGQPSSPARPGTRRPGHHGARSRPLRGGDDLLRLRRAQRRDPRAAVLHPLVDGRRRQPRLGRGLGRHRLALPRRVRAGASISTGLVQRAGPARGDGAERAYGEAEVAGEELYSRGQGVSCSTPPRSTEPPGSSASAGPISTTRRRPRRATRRASSSTSGTTAR